MNKKNIYFAFAILILLGVGLFFIFNKNKNPEISTLSTEPILFYSINCPHCQNVEKFLDSNEIREKIKLTEKSIDNNTENTNELISYAKKCGNEGDSVSIPFLWNGTNCFIGEQDIINYLSGKIK